MDTNERFLKLNPHLQESSGSEYVQLVTVDTMLQTIEQKMEQLITKYEEMQKTNALQASLIVQLTQERDSLLSRLHAARSRVDDLIARLPENENH